jgi:uncharacterized cupredoxin-like copper-binding protein
MPATPHLLAIATLLALGAPGAFGHEGHDTAAKAAKAPAASPIGRPGDAKRVSRTVEVSMDDDMRFKPASISVKRNETIRFVVRNVGKLKHEMVLGRLGDLKQHALAMRASPAMEHEEPNAVEVDPGKTGTLVWQFTRAGTVDFACLEPGHFEAGMVGRVAVK